MKVFDALKERKVLERVNKFLGILIRENLVKNSPFLKEGEIENESDLADDVWEVLQGVPRNCDVGTAEEQAKRFHSFCKKFQSDIKGMCSSLCPYINCCDMCHCITKWEQMPYEEEGAK